MTPQDAIARLSQHPDFEALRKLLAGYVEGARLQLLQPEPGLSAEEHLMKYRVACEIESLLTIATKPKKKTDGRRK